MCRSQIVLLDILIKKDNNVLVTDLYYKTTDTHQYLYYTSNHPRHTKNNIHYNLARRICTIINGHGTNIYIYIYIYIYKRKVLVYEM